MLCVAQATWFYIFMILSTPKLAIVLEIVDKPLETSERYLLVILCHTACTYWVVFSDYATKYHPSEPLKCPFCSILCFMCTHNGKYLSPQWCWFNPFTQSFGTCSFFNQPQIRDFRGILINTSPLSKYGSREDSSVIFWKNSPFWTEVCTKPS